MQVKSTTLCACGCGGFVNRYRKWIWKHSPPTAKPITPLDVRFWRHVTKDGPIPPHCPEIGSCWTWDGFIATNGYAYMWLSREKKMILVHRLSWELHNGPIPEGLWVLHKCDNRACPNPHHFFLGTHQDNIADMILKGRGAHKMGEDASAHKLTTIQVLEIRERSRKGEDSLSLSKEYGVGHSTVCSVVNRKSWKHI